MLTRFSLSVPTGISIGFRCKDGVVLASDTMLLQGSHKVRGRKQEARERKEGRMQEGRQVGRRRGGRDGQTLRSECCREAGGAGGGGAEGAKTLKQGERVGLGEGGGTRTRTTKGRSSRSSCSSSCCCCCRDEVKSVMF